MSATELGSPIGLGLADWDLEAFWRARAWAADKGEEAPHARAVRGLCVEDLDPASPCDDEEKFWDAASSFSEDGEERSAYEQGDAGEPGPCRDGDLASGVRDGESLGLPMAELIRGKAEERDTLAALSLSGSEDELDRWMLGSRSQTTEDSTPGSAASSTLDSAEWGVFEPLSGPGTPAAGEASPVHSKEPTGQGVLSPGGGPGPALELVPDSDLIPDSDLGHLLQVFEEEDAEMMPPQQGGSSTPVKQRAGAQHTCEEARPSARAGVASPGGTVSGGPALEAVSGSTGGSSKTAKSSTGAGSGWRLLMRRNSELMQFSSWVRDRGRNFGTMEFRGRMLLLPRPAAPPQAAKNGVPTAASPQQWGAATVRDFLLDEVHRAEWDESREASEVVQEWDESGRSTARWVRRLPLFLRSREYVVGRRVWSPASCPGEYYCISKSTEHPAAPRKSTTVRVSSFFSSWRVRPLSREETEQARQELAASSKQGAHGKGNRKTRGQAAVDPPAESVDSWLPAVEVITHHEEESGLPRDLVRMGVAHGMWGHMLKMEQALSKYYAAGRSLRHLLPLFLLQAEQLAAAAREAGATCDPEQLAASLQDEALAGCEVPCAHSICALELSATASAPMLEPAPLSLDGS